MTRANKHEAPLTAGATRTHETESGSAQAALQAPQGPGPSHLSAEERHLIETWNATQRVFPHDRMVPQLVAGQAALRPSAPALLAGGGTLTYQHLNQRANQVANYLRRQGVGPGVLVAVCMERSMAMVIALLGVLKAGGAYVPLDPQDPPARRSFVLRDSHAPILITQASLAETMPVTETHMICLDSADEELALAPETECPFASTLDDRAYVIYTSGTTGQPKGVQITHRNLLNLVYWHQHAFAITPADRATQLATPAFDAAVWELWPYLIAGASVSLPDVDVHRTPGALRDWLVEQEITVTFVPTPLAEELLRLPWPKECALRFLLTGADTLHRAPPPDLPFTLINNYGPTECTVVATSGCVDPSTGPSSAPSIGRPIANTQVYILDEQLGQVPIGTAGELYIAGAGLACGYLNRPELTAQRFIPHPFSNEPGARLYRTGDLARYFPDGSISFLGRVDFQVKVRGYRVETEEVAAALADHPAVRASAVVAQGDTTGQQQLVGYLVVDPEAMPTALALHDHLATRLPPYMIPATFVLMDTLPTLPSGKIDHRALPAPTTATTVHAGAESEAEPQSLIEGHMAEIVCALLRLERVGLDDNFFMLGGHSMLGTQLIVRLSETYGIELPLRSLFDHPTVRELAGEVEQLILAQ